MKSGLSKARFEAVFQNGKRVHGALLRLIALDGDGRVGFTTPKKLGNTPRRNRLKRRLREAVRISREPIPEGWDAIFVAHLTADTAPFGQLLADVESAIKKMRERWESESECS